jgi:hypothetical protein
MPVVLKKNNDRREKKPSISNLREEEEEEQSKKEQNPHLPPISSLIKTKRVTGLLTGNLLKTGTNTHVDCHATP